jgi:hypothetical protein
LLKEIEGKLIMANIFKHKELREIQATHTLEKDQYLVLMEVFQVIFLTQKPIKH